MKPAIYKRASMGNWYRNQEAYNYFTIFILKSQAIDINYKNLYNYGE